MMKIGTKRPGRHPNLGVRELLDLLERGESPNLVGQKVLFSFLFPSFSPLFFLFILSSFSPRYHLFKEIFVYQPSFPQLLV